MAAPPPAASGERSPQAERGSILLRGLGAHPFLLPLLEEAHSRIQERFPGSRVFLQMLGDPEDPANSQLVAFIATESDAATAFQNPQALDASWWLSAMDQAQSKFHINLEPA